MCYMIAFMDEPIINHWQLTLTDEVSLKKMIQKKFIQANSPHVFAHLKVFKLKFFFIKNKIILIE